MNKIYLYPDDVANKEVWYALCKVAGVIDTMIDDVYLVVDIQSVEHRIILPSE